MRSSIHFKAPLVLTLLLILLIGIALLGWVGSRVHAAGVSTTGTRTFTFNAANFHHSTRIDNQFYPLLPGTEFLYQGDEGGQALHNTVLVTHDTKSILGISTVVVLDTVYMKNGQLFEKTLDWYAQDDQRNVWYLGEAATDYQNGKPAGHTGSWEAGDQGAQPGVIMEGNPKVGDSYRQEYLKGVAQDMASVLSLNGHACVPFNCHFNKTVITKDAPAAQLAAAIRRAVAGERIIDPTLAMTALSERNNPLTEREREVLAAATSGASIAEIAASLFLSEGTVRNYLSMAIQKLGAQNRVEAARIAEQKGWL
jgi:DNA-binding CsgD family transcriptional regulator